MDLWRICRDCINSSRGSNGTGGCYLEKSGDDLLRMHWNRVKL